MPSHARKLRAKRAARSEPEASAGGSAPAPGPSRTGRTLYLDCFSGAAGNMLLGALLELGAPARGIREALAGLGVDGLRMRVTKVRRGALAASHVAFHAPRRKPSQRRWRSIRRLLQRADLPARVRKRSLAAFAALAEAEARVHGIETGDVHFHEVGAADAIGDIVGVAAALELLGVGEVAASPLPLGRGFVDTDHGRLPLPAPATLELLRGVPTYPADVEWETVTPTGAALLTTLATHFGPMPALVPEAQGFGAGDDRAGPVPNVLRACLGSAAAGLATDVVTVIETNLDDMSPEHLPYLLERLMEDGALDASLAPLAMKKGRPGTLLRVLARPQDRERLARRVLLESTALGVRYVDMPRLVLERKSRRVDTRFGRIGVKVARGPDGRVLAAPEYESCARAARRHGVALAEVYRAAERAAEDLQE